jgi:hypothetical protein
MRVALEVADVKEPVRIRTGIGFVSAISTGHQDLNRLLKYMSAEAAFL